MPDWLSQLTDPQLGALSAGALLALVWGIVFAESGVLPFFWLPGDTVLFTAGLISAAPGSGVHAGLLAAGVAVAATAGNGLGYWTGRRLGRPVLERRSPRAREHLRRAEALYERWGVMALVVARFIPWARTFVPVLAGVGRMPYRSFALATLGGALVWGAGLVLLGWGAHFVPWLQRAALVVAGVAVASSVVVPVAAAARARLARRRRAEEERGGSR